MHVGRLAAIAAITLALLSTGRVAAGARPSGPKPPGPTSGPVTHGTPWFTQVTGSAVNVSGNYVPIVGEFDATGGDDIIWYAAGSTSEQLWSGRESGTTPFVKQTLSQQVSGTYVPIAGNFGGDSHTDILWYGPGSQPDFLWISNGDGTFTTHSASIAGVYDHTVVHNSLPSHDAILWTVPDDGGPGSLWQFSSSGAHTSFAETVAGTPQILTADFDHNGLGDLFLYNPGSGADALWRRNASSNGTFTVTPETVNGTYTPVLEQFTPNVSGTPDDILWDQPGNGSASLWQGQSNGTFVKSNHALPLGNPIALHQGYGYVLTWGTAGADEIWYANNSGPDYLSADDNTKASPAAMPIVGEFNAPYPSVLFYRPGSGAELLLIGT